MMETLEKFHIYIETKLGRQINDRNTVTQNILFDTLVQGISLTPSTTCNSLAFVSGEPAIGRPTSQPKTIKSTPITVSHYIYFSTHTRLIILIIYTSLQIYVLERLHGDNLRCSNTNPTVGSFNTNTWSKDAGLQSYNETKFYLTKPSTYNHLSTINTTQKQQSF